MKLFSIMLIAFSMAACNSPSNTSQGSNMGNGCGCCKKCLVEPKKKAENCTSAVSKDRCKPCETKRAPSKPDSCNSCPRSDRADRCKPCETKPAPKKAETCPSCPRSDRCKPCEKKAAPSMPKTCRSCSGSSKGCSSCTN